MTLRFADKLVFGLLFLAAFLLLLSVIFYNQGQIVAFYLLSGIMLISAIGVMKVKEIIHSAFLLALSFLCLGGLFVTLQADFLAAAQILIYAGAVAILFVFGIMLTQPGQTQREQHTPEFKMLSLIFISFGLFIMLGRAIYAAKWKLSKATPTPDLNTIEVIGQKFFDTYLVPFEVASVVLLMALIGAIVIAKKEDII